MSGGGDKSKNESEKIKAGRQKRGREGKKERKESQI